MAIPVVEIAIESGLLIHGKNRYGRMDRPRRPGSGSDVVRLSGYLIVRLHLRLADGRHWRLMDVVVFVSYLGSDGFVQSNIPKTLRVRRAQADQSNRYYL